jgi:hypothetical protein
MLLRLFHYKNHCFAIFAVTARTVTWAPFSAGTETAEVLAHERRGVREKSWTKKEGFLKPSFDARRHYPLLLILYPSVGRLLSGYLLNVTHKNTLVFSPAVILSPRRFPVLRLLSQGVTTSNLLPLSAGSDSRLCLTDPVECPHPCSVPPAKKFLATAVPRPIGMILETSCCLKAGLKYGSCQFWYTVPKLFSLLVTGHTQLRRSRKAPLIPDSAVASSVGRWAQALHGEANGPVPLISRWASVHRVIPGDKAQRRAKRRTRP